MENEILSEEEIKEIEEVKKTNAQMRGSAFLQDLEFIRKREGEEGIKKLQDLIAKFGYELDFKKIKPKESYPLWIGTAMIFAIKRLFNYGDKEFEEMGRYNAKTNFFARLLIRYMVSLDAAGRMVSSNWRKYFSVGNLENPEYSNERRYSILRLYDFPSPPEFCSLLRGYFAATTEMIVGKNATCEETKCTNKGDSYHEFKITW